MKEPWERDETPWTLDRIRSALSRRYENPPHGALFALATAAYAADRAVRNLMDDPKRQAALVKAAHVLATAERRLKGYRKSKDVKASKGQKVSSLDKRYG